METVTAKMMNTSVPVWAWNGYNSQWVQCGLTRDEACAQASEIVKKAEKFSHDSKYTVLEDSEVFTVQVIDSYDLHGWRESVHIFTTRIGQVEHDPDDNLRGDWVNL